MKRLTSEVIEKGIYRITNTSKTGYTHSYIRASFHTTYRKKYSKSYPETEKNIEKLRKWREEIKLQLRAKKVH